MSSYVNRVAVPLCLTAEERERARALSPIANSGMHRGKPSVSEMVRRLLPIGELARELVPEGQLPWAVVEEILRAAVIAHRERRAGRRVRT